MSTPWAGRGVWHITLDVAGGKKEVNLTRRDLREVLAQLTPQEAAEIRATPGTKKAETLVTAAIVRWLVL